MEDKMVLIFDTGISDRMKDRVHSLVMNDLLLCESYLTMELQSSDIKSQILTLVEDMIEDKKETPTAEVIQSADIKDMLSAQRWLGRITTLTELKGRIEAL